MSDSVGPITRENLPTVVAVAAITAVLALSYGVYLNRQIHVVAVGATALDVKAARRDVERDRQVEALTKRIEVLEAAAKPAEPVATAGAGDAASVPVGEAAPAPK